MKIAFLTLYSGLLDRGVETFVKEVGNRLAKNNEVIVFQAGPARGQEKYKVTEIKMDPDLSKRDGSGQRRNIFFLDSYGRTTIKFIFKVLPFLWKERFDVLIPTDGGWETAVCRILTLIRGGKVIVSGQSGPGYDDRWNLLWKPSIFVALTESTQNWAKKAGFGTKVTMIPNGVDVKKFNLKIKPSTISLPKPLVLCASALTDSKRIDLVIKAAAKLNNTSLLVVGEGPNKDQLEELGKNLMGERFNLTGASHEEMPGIYRSANLFTMVSVPWESFGIVYVEAMASGLPVVATDTQARRGIIGDAGLFVDPENIDEYAKILDRALKTDWGNKPRKQAEKFSWDKIAKDYEDVMQDMI